MDTVGIIYDTSFLMLNKPPPVWETLQESVFLFRREGVSRGWFSKKTEAVIRSSFFDEFQIVEVLPTEVGSEICGHFDDEEKMKPAKKARKIVAELLARGAREICLRDKQCSVESTGELGADSEVDRLILGYALAMVESKQWCLSIIATDDGGVLYDSVKWWAAGRKVWCHTKERRDFEQVMQYLAEVLQRKEKYSGSSIESGFCDLGSFYRLS
jgi:hypothetical protein